MFEAKLSEALVLKKIIDAIRDLVTDVNIDATPQGKFETIKYQKLLAHDLIFVRSIFASHGQLPCSSCLAIAGSEWIRVLSSRSSNDSGSINH